jgi:hypothetical protein
MALKVLIQWLKLQTTLWKWLSSWKLEVEAEGVAELLESHEVLFILVYLCLFSFPRIRK